MNGKMNKFDPSTLPSSFYRVTAKALIFDEEGRLLVIKNHKGGSELPGGGIEFGEDIEKCLRRELQEELHVSLETCGPIACMYGRVNSLGIHIIRLAAVCRVNSHEFTPDDGIKEAKFVTRDEFMALNLERHEGNIHDFTDIIWSETKE